jgi:hypothetical protein
MRRTLQKKLLPGREDGLLWTGQTLPAGLRPPPLLVRALLG